MERTHPEFAGSLFPASDLAMDPEVAHMHRVVSASDSAVRFGPGTNNPISSGMAEHFSQAPWGGFKYSGVGREYGRYWIEAFLEPKAILE